MVTFSDEEGYGKYLDLQECYNIYLQLKGIEVREMCTWLISLPKLESMIMCIS